MKNTKRPSRDLKRSMVLPKVEPSARDPINSWLDVMMGMLALPNTQRKQVRDELEDHLRSRVDDLLIIGKTEQEAVRTAVAELGETAELAKLISQAHSHSIARRSIMNTLLISTAVAGVTFGGFAFLNPTSSTHSPSTQNIQSDIHAHEIHEPAQASDQQSIDQVDVNVPIEARVIQLDIQNMKFVEAFGMVAGKFGLTPSLSATMLRRYKSLGPVVTVAGQMTLDQAMSQLLTFDPYGVESNAYYIENGVISITDPSVVIRRSVQIQTFPIDWADDYEIDRLATTIRKTIGNGRYSQHLSVEVVGRVLVVNARPEAIEQIDKIIREVQVVNEVMTEHDAHDQRTALQKIQAEYLRVQKELVAASARVRHIESLLFKTKLPNARTEPGVRSEQAENGNGNTVHDIESYESERQLAQMNLEEHAARHAYLRDRMIELEYEELFAQVD